MNDHQLDKLKTNMHYRIRFTPPALRQPLIILLLSVLLAVPAALAAPTEKILILPFTIHAEKDLSFLNQGMMSMLLSRLAKPGKTVTESVSQLPATPKEIQALALSRGAKYYTTGSLTLFGNSVSTDARLIETETGKTVVAFSQYGERAGDVLAHMDAFARQIDARFTAAAAPKPTAPVPATSATASAAVAANAAAVVMPPATPTPGPVVHPVGTQPESTPEMSATATSTGATGMTVSAAAIPESVDNAPAFFESQPLGEEIRSITTGDLDGDGRMEIICASAHRISVYSFVDGKLVPQGGYNAEKELSIISVDADDLNGNGRSEIFVSTLLEMPRSRQPDVRQWGLRSLVLEQQNGRLLEIAADLKLYFRSLVLPNNERLILGQKRGISGTYGEQDFMNKTGTGSLFLGNVFRLEYKDGLYTPGDPVLLPKNITIYDFTLGDILNDGSEIITALKGKGYLTLLEPSGKKKWSGKDRYGGTATFLEYPSMEGSSEMDRYYIRQRLFVTDIDADGNNEVVLADNYDFTYALASRTRIYTNGTVACLSWGRRSLIQKWKTEEMAGFIGDLAVDDITGDGRPELVYAVVEKSANSFSDGESFIVIQKPPAGISQPSS